MREVVKNSLCGIILFLILILGSTYEERQNARHLVKNLPKPMVDYICNETGYDSTKVSGQLLIRDYYLNNERKLEDMAYEYDWYYY